MSLNNVFAFKCEEYNSSVYEILNRIFQESGLKNELLPGKTVLIKANLLMGKDPKYGVTTHPVIVHELIKILEEMEMKVIVADSPGGPLNETYMRSVYNACKMNEAVEGTAATLNYDFSSREVHFEKSTTLKKFEILNVVLDADYVINVAKLKTHGMMTYTGAVKNLYGAIPGLIKANHHFKLSEKSLFASHIVDICEYINPVFSIIDGVEGMEGNGPSGGEVVNTGIIFGSKSPFALDDFASKLIGIEERLIPTIINSRSRELVGDYKIITDVDETKVKPYKLPDSADVSFMPNWVPGLIKKVIIKNMKYRPVFIHNKCVKCKKCEDICPAKIISMNSSGYPIYKSEKCISCFCCHEVCPYRAISIKKPLLARLFSRK